MLYNVFEQTDGGRSIRDKRYHTCAAAYLCAVLLYVMNVTTPPTVLDAAVGIRGATNKLSTDPIY
jgi:hypothetical protein